MGHVFLSYARRDSEFADRLVAAIESRGFDIWLDRSDIPGGAEWEASISRALEDSIGVIVILSPAANESEHVGRELSLASDYKRSIIPVEYKPTPLDTERSPAAHRIRFRIAGLQRIDFVDQDFDAAVDRVVDALGAKRQPARVPGAKGSRPDRGRFRRRAFAEVLVVVGGLAAVALAVVAWINRHGDVERGERQPAPIHRPIVSLALTSDDEIVFQNQGDSPATLESFEVSFDGEAMRNWRDLLERLGVRKEVEVLWYPVLPQGQHRRILKIRGGSGELRNNGTRMAFEFCYCAAADECWNGSWRGSIGREASGSCPATRTFDVRPD